MDPFGGSFVTIWIRRRTSCLLQLKAIALLRFAACQRLFGDAVWLVLLTGHWRFLFLSRIPTDFHGIERKTALKSVEIRD